MVNRIRRCLTIAGQASSILFLVFVALTYLEQRNFNKEQISFNEQQVAVSYYMLRPYVYCQVKKQVTFLLDEKDNAKAAVFHGTFNNTNLTPAKELKRTAFLTLDSLFPEDALKEKRHELTGSDVMLFFGSPVDFKTPPLAFPSSITNEEVVAKFKSQGFYLHIFVSYRDVFDVEREIRITSHASGDNESGFTIQQKKYIEKTTKGDFLKNIVMKNHDK